MKRLALALLLVGCARTLPPVAPVSPDVEQWATLVDVDDKREEADEDARLRYLVGDMPAAGDVGKAAYRSVCKENHVDREFILDALREHGQIHAFAWADWYDTHCGPKPGASTNGFSVISRETGKPARPGDVLEDVLAVCSADAGTPPAKEYWPTPAEQIAKMRRDACDAAQ